MLRILDRFRGARAEVRIESRMETPPDEHSGGVVRLAVTLNAKHPVRIRRGLLQLALLSTHFSRTTLDGYLEHTSKDVLQTFVLCENTVLQPGIPLTYPVHSRLPEASLRDSRPVRMQWQAEARFKASGREFGASRIVCDVSPAKGGAPVVDGTGFLPLYKFRSSENP